MTMDRLIGILAVLLVVAAVLPSIAAVAGQLVPVLAFLIICLFAVRLWLGGFNS